ncbi:VanZ family protein [Streptococcus sp. Marseille-P7376]|uniref:VanZ family protein n=1 Tax=Streptococcus sp. Marseille-P7376 TaxID=2592044 RepID=UPI0011E78DE4|nr:VanZ family protein [Streptococcus sp. Marseille-P7376]
MFSLKNYLTSDGELTAQGRRLLIGGCGLYFLMLCLMCFLPQTPEPGMETPGIQYFGRVVVLLIPFNSFVNLGEITSWLQLVKVFVQNLANIFLLSPLIFQLLWLFPQLRSTKRIVWLSFAMSLAIEMTQILLDLLINANRVFEIDDLWTNTLGGYLAWRTFQLCQKFLKNRQDDAFNLN